MTGGLPWRRVPDLESIDAPVLLGRPERALRCDAAAAIRDQCVLVTGAGGSVGVPLVERLLRLGPAQLVLLDNHEDSLVRLQRRLRNRAQMDCEATPAALVLCDVRNRAKLASLFDTWRPQTVFHLAAYKHVHLGEAQPDEPLAVNVLGTQALVETAIATGVEVFVYTSSDKAASPTAVYGATKRLAEIVVHHAGARAACRCVVVRFVNVLGTRGSVIEAFLEQLAGDQPLTITDPAMSRYWMSMPEAVALLLAAASEGLAGSTLLLDPGDPVSVLEMAERLRTLVGLGDSPLSFQQIGVRPGERITEALVSPAERLAQGPLPHLLVVDPPARPALLAVVPRLLESIQAAMQGDDASLAARLLALAREVQ